MSVMFPCWSHCDHWHQQIKWCSKPKICEYKQHMTLHCGFSHCLMDVTLGVWLNPPSHFWFPVRQLFWRACIQTSQKNYWFMCAKLSNSIHQRIVIFIISTSPVVGVTCVLFELVNNTITVLVWLMFFCGLYQSWNVCNALWTLWFT